MVTSCFLSIRFFGVSVIWCCFAYWAFSPSCTFCSFVVDRHRRFFSSVCTFVRTFVRTFEINQQNLHKTNRATKIQLDFFSIASLLPPHMSSLASSTRSCFLVYYAPSHILASTTALVDSFTPQIIITCLFPDAAASVVVSLVSCLCACCLFLLSPTEEDKLVKYTLV